MQNSDQDDQNLGKTPGMDNSTAMTIEFLRARLLAERSISRSARQRADDLEKRVAELEEQLKFVSLQRKMAEKATADVLAILEDNGISDISETLDSNSDQDAPYESKLDDEFTRENMSFVNSKVRKNELEEISGSNFDTFSVQGRSLSWKGRNNSPHSHGMYKESCMRRWSSYPFPGSSSPTHWTGRSCRKIKRRETRLRFEDDDLKTERIEDNAAATTLEGHPNCSDLSPKKSRDDTDIQEEEILVDGPPVSSSENNGSVVHEDLDFNGYRKDNDMEQALAHQAQLIDRYETMEKAQREWEEKFKENNGSTLDLINHGNHFDISNSEERDELRTHPSNSSVIASHTKDKKSDPIDVSFAKSADAQPSCFPSRSCVDKGGFSDQKSKTIASSESSVEEFSFPMEKVKQTTDGVDCNNSCKNDVSRGRIDDFAPVPQEPPALGSVLESLKQARLSLQQKITKLPLIESESVRNDIRPSISAPRIADKVDNHVVGCAGLFRLPTDFPVEATRQNNLLGQGSQFRSPNYILDDGTAVYARNRFLASPYMEIGPSFSREDYLLTNLFPRPSVSPHDRFHTHQVFHLGENGWRDPSAQRPHFDPSAQSSHFDPYIDASSPHSRMLNSSVPDSRDLPSTEGFSRTFPGRIVGIPPAGNITFYGDQIRPYMRNR